MHRMGIRAAVAGASGYSGGEVVRYLGAHPGIEVVAVGAAANAGRPVAEVHPHLGPGIDLPLVSLDELASAQPDVLFSCLPSGSLDGTGVSAPALVDLSDDHRA